MASYDHKDKRNLAPRRGGEVIAVTESRFAIRRQ
jgi:hypothetical protein